MGRSMLGSGLKTYRVDCQACRVGFEIPESTSHNRQTFYRIVLVGPGSVLNLMSQAADAGRNSRDA